MDNVNVTIKYKAGHSYSFEYYYEKDMYCPNCGEQSVWIENDPGDYYVGPVHVCVSCNSDFALPYLADADYCYRQVTEQIKRANGG